MRNQDQDDFNTAVLVTLETLRDELKAAQEKLDRLMIGSDILGD